MSNYETYQELRAEAERATAAEAAFRAQYNDRRSGSSLWHDLTDAGCEAAKARSAMNECTYRRAERRLEAQNGYVDQATVRVKGAAKEVTRAQHRIAQAHYILEQRKEELARLQLKEVSQRTVHAKALADFHEVASR